VNPNNWLSLSRSKNGLELVPWYMWKLLTYQLSHCLKLEVQSHSVIGSLIEDVGIGNTARM